MPRIDKMNTRKILEALQKGEIKLSDAEAQLKGFEDLGHSRVDLEREERNGIPEVIYGCLLYTSPSPRDGLLSRMPSSA